jgi:predicted aminopeptidase
VKRAYSIFGTLSLASLLFGCQSMYYYGQAINGQLNILMKRQPISELLADPDTPENLRQRLEFVLKIRQFAREKLYLPVDDNYRTYVKLNRPFVAWNVYAAPEFSLIPKTWCYPIVGCVTYRGYFSDKAALRYAATLKKRSYDVYVGGVIAYSTLGWFDDPVFSTIMRLSRTESAALVFHELAHQVLYVPDDTAFDESFATAVEQEGLRRWLKSLNDPRTFDDYLLKYRRYRQFIDLVMKCCRRLESLYQSDLPSDQKRAAKEKALGRLQMEYENLKKEWKGASDYDAWFSRPLNNAQLSSVVTYEDFVPAFLELLKKKNGDLKQFYQECQNLAAKPKAERDRILGLTQK